MEQFRPASKFVIIAITKVALIQSISFLEQWQIICTTVTPRDDRPMVLRMGMVGKLIAQGAMSIVLKIHKSQLLKKAIESVNAGSATTSVRNGRKQNGLSRDSTEARIHAAPKGLGIWLGH